MSSKKFFLLALLINVPTLNLAALNNGQFRSLRSLNCQKQKQSQKR